MPRIPALRPSDTHSLLLSLAPELTPLAYSLALMDPSGKEAGADWLRCPPSGGTHHVPSLDAQVSLLSS